MNQATKKFWKLNKTERRKAVLNDAKQQILSENFKPADKRVWTEMPETIEDLAATQELQSALKSAKCTGCMLGGLFISTIRVGDKLTIGDFREQCPDSGTFGNISTILLKEKLTKIFSHNEIFLMESAYERGSISNSNEKYDLPGQDKIDFDNAVAFGEDISSKRGRMLAIIDNALANNGTFTPYDK